MTQRQWSPKKAIWWTLSATFKTNVQDCRQKDSLYSSTLFVRLASGETPGSFRSRGSFHAEPWAHRELPCGGSLISTSGRTQPPEGTFGRYRLLQQTGCVTHL